MESNDGIQDRAGYYARDGGRQMSMDEDDGTTGTAIRRALQGNQYIESVPFGFQGLDVVEQTLTLEREERIKMLSQRAVASVSQPMFSHVNSNLQLRPAIAKDPVNPYQSKDQGQTGGFHQPQTNSGSSNNPMLSSRRRPIPLRQSQTVQEAFGAVKHFPLPCLESESRGKAKPLTASHFPAYQRIWDKFESKALSMQGMSSEERLEFVRECFFLAIQNNAIDWKEDAPSGDSSKQSPA